ncbi:DEAD/DEAH box helicase [Brevibacillus fluminis]|uniref:DEAD/DEAH box helicase n=1 Tax=Brevibacillus fluminis TaxID=511487 RepID=A0A3M8DQN1_9BACL|nr:DEAD/DEAH box helicase [Brevibacillus fluminis]RNB90274.1 DEAD/DEAH box helicase [Brevibacillus fluminis]
MTALHTVTIHAQWIEDGSVFIRALGPDGQDLQPELSRNILFGWHAESFYGALIPVTDERHQRGLILDASMALDFFASPTVLEHAYVTWDETAVSLTRLAPILSQSLREGLYAPDPFGWDPERSRWKLFEPPAEWSESDLRLANDWLSSALQQLLRDKPDIRQAWDRIVSAYPLLQTTNADRDRWLEDEWLVTVGWKQDAAPFRTCLKLDEPAFGTGSWKLSIWLQDRDLESALIACSPSGEAIDDPFPPHWSGWLDRVEKDVQRWIKLLPWLAGSDPAHPLRTTLDDDMAWTLLSEGSVRLAEAGYTLFLPSWWEKLKKAQIGLKASMAQNIGSPRESLLGLNSIMQFDWKLAVDDVELTDDEFNELLAQKKRLAYIRGRWVQVDQELLRRVQQVISKAEKKNGLTFRDVLEMHLLGTLPDELGGQEVEDLSSILQVSVELNQHLSQMIEQLTTHEHMPSITPPDTFRGTLRNYQLAGSSWLTFLRRFGLGGCLADDMGLGKTVQFIAYLLHVKESDQQQGASAGTPSLLVCPTSVLGNWQKELQRFAPELKVHLHYGTNRAKEHDFPASIRDADLVLTSYTLAHLDTEELAGVYWNTICLDEAQNIKNVHTKQAQSIRRLDGHHRIALTGTPIENRLTELWSIFDFLNPGYLGSLRTFQHRFVIPIEKNNDSRSIEGVQRLVRPFLLRRVKNDPSIQLDLPDKNEAKEYVSLTAEQAALYENIIQDMFSRIESASPMERRGLIFAVLTKLKQLCNHPALLLREKNAQWRGRSNKIERLLEQIEELRQEGGQCLVFTQFVEMGHLLQAILEEERKERVFFLHGGVPKGKRDEMISHFQDLSLPAEQRCGIFLLSLKAGGTGLNLTAANHVFHVDRWWNPAVENQATDRAYRIGQTRNVQVHKFVTLGTLEERIDEMLERKQGINDQIMNGGENWITELSTEELRDLFALRREWIE